MFFERAKELTISRVVVLIVQSMINVFSAFLDNYSTAGQYGPGSSVKSFSFSNIFVFNEEYVSRTQLTLWITFLR